MKNKILSPWIIVEDYCATRVYHGTNPDEIKNRVAFIEKSGRVRRKDFVERINDNEKWESVSRGSSDYGMDMDTRSEVDDELRKMGYLLQLEL